VQLFFVYYGFSMSAFMRETWAWYFFENAWFCSIFALTLNTAAYQAEIFRGALQVVPSAQIDAAWSLGLSKNMTFWLVRVPEAFRLSLPGYGNELILLLKATSIVSTITILDLLGTAKLIVHGDIRPHHTFIAGGSHLFDIGVASAAGALGSRMVADATHERCPSSQAAPARPSCALFGTRHLQIRGR